MKDSSECYNATYGIKEWVCDIECQPIYYEDCLRGYKNLCPACYAAKEETFTYPCQDSFCIGDETISLTGGQVAGHYRNLAEKPDWTFPPVRCTACRDWLRNAKQQKRDCISCGWTYVYPVGLMKRIKKTEGDPAELGPKYCPKCARMTAEERSRFVNYRATQAEFRRNTIERWHKKAALPHAIGFIDPLSGVRTLRDPNGLLGRMLHNAKVLRGQRPASLYKGPFQLVHKVPIEEDRTTVTIDVITLPTSAALPLNARVSAKDIEQYKHDFHKEDKTRYGHLAKHLTDFRPQEATVEQSLLKSETVLNSTDATRVVTLVNTKNGNIVRVDVLSSRCVVTRPDGYIVTQYPLSKGRQTSPSIAVSKIESKIAGDEWSPVYA